MNDFFIRNSAYPPWGSCCRAPAPDRDARGGSCPAPRRNRQFRSRTPRPEIAIAPVSHRDHVPVANRCSGPILDRWTFYRDARRGRGSTRLRHSAIAAQRGRGSTRLRRSAVAARRTIAVNEARSRPRPPAGRTIPHDPVRRAAHRDARHERSPARPLARGSPSSATGAPRARPGGPVVRRPDATRPGDTPPARSRHPVHRIISDRALISCAFDDSLFRGHRSTDAVRVAGAAARAPAVRTRALGAGREIIVRDRAKPARAITESQSNYPDDSPYHRASH
jgi:hypothetical protein